MSRIRIIENLNVDPSDLDYCKWPTVYMDNRNEVFEKRKKAVELYIDQDLSITQIEQLTGIHRKEINSLLIRCIKKDNKGRLWGYRALIPYKRLGTTYDRLSSADGFREDLKFTGAFMQLLQKYPKLNEFIKDYIYNRRKRAAADKVIRIIDLREKFLKIVPGIRN